MSIRSAASCVQAGLWAAAWLVSLSGCSPGSSIELTILHTNDTHARLMEFDRFGSTCDATESANGACFGGVGRRATAVARLRQDREHILFLDAGDQFQGTLFYSRFKGLAVQRAMSELGYDAMVVGNHEFDDGPEILGRFIDGVSLPVLGSNVDTSMEPALSGLRNQLVLERGGRRIGIVGYITEETATLSSPGPTVSFEPIEEALEREIVALESQGINIIIALSHAGYERDLKIASRVRGLDIIVGGHTNTLLSNDAPDAEAEYPVAVEGPEDRLVLVVTAFAWGKYLGHLDATFDGSGRLAKWSGNPLLLDAQVEPDPSVDEWLEPLAREIESFHLEAIGESTVDLIGRERDCRAQECNLGNLIADALLEEHRESGAEIALQNGGGIRASIGRGTITVGGLLEVLPFGNTASTFQLRGGDLLAALEHGVSRAENLDNDGTGRFLQVAGLRYSWSAEEPVGERILRAETLVGDEGWQPLDEQRVYHVVMNGFNRAGGDGYDMLRDRAIDPYDQGRLLSDIVRDYISRRTPISVGLDGRIVRAQ